MSFAPLSRQALHSALAWPRRRARALLAWALWSRIHFTIALTVVVTIVGLALTVTLTGLIVSLQNASQQAQASPAAGGPPLPGAGDALAAAPATPAATAVPLPGARPAGPSAAATPAQVAREFMTLWLSGAHRPATKAEHDAWVAQLAPYGGAGLPGLLFMTPLESIPDGTVVDVRVDLLMQSATATVTLSTGSIVLVQLMEDPAGWRVHGFHAAS